MLNQLQLDAARRQFFMVYFVSTRCSYDLLMHTVLVLMLKRRRETALLKLYEMEATDIQFPSGTVYRISTRQIHGPKCNSEPYTKKPLHLARYLFNVDVSLGEFCRKLNYALRENA